MSDPKPTYVTFVLDETGSMSSIKDDTIGGFNQYVDTLKKDAKGEVKFTLVKFDSNHTTKVCVGVDIANAPKLTDDTYRPGAMTPLIDASVKAIKATEEQVAEQDVTVIVVIQTDGDENASSEYKTADLAALVKEKTAAGWAFVFIGAGIDAFDAAAQYGIIAANTMSYDRGETKAAFAATAHNTAQVAATGDANLAAYSGQQRTAAGDKFHDKHTSKTTAPPPTAAKPTTAKVVDDMSFVG